MATNICKMPGANTNTIFVLQIPLELMQSYQTGNLASQPSIDSNFFNEPNNTTFVNYLRICFDNCGFPGITRADMQNNYQDFFNKVKPQLKPI